MQSIVQVQFGWVEHQRNPSHVDHTPGDIAYFFTWSANRTRPDMFALYSAVGAFCQFIAKIEQGLAPY
jgi:hypothetical protein